MFCNVEVMCGYQVNWSLKGKSGRGVINRGQAKTPQTTHRTFPHQVVINKTKCGKKPGRRQEALALRSPQ